MKKHKSEEEHSEASEAWLLPYSDLMTLLLAVFIVLFAVSQMDSEKAKNISSAFQQIFGSSTPALLDNGENILDSGGGPVDSLFPPIVIDIPAGSNTKPPTQGNLSGSDSEIASLEALQDELRTYLQHTELEDVINITLEDRGLVISLTKSILFDSGKAEIKPEYEDILLTIGKSLNELENFIRIEGHTDNVPMNNASALYPTNWELSTARAVRTVRFFIDDVHMDPNRLVAVGYGEYKPVAENSTSEGRSKNRRVDIIVLNTKYNALEESFEE